MKSSFPREVLSDVTKGLVKGMAPYCERVAIAGSLRRGCAYCSDIELCLIPRWKEGMATSLFGDPERLNCALIWAFDAEARGAVRWIKPGTSEIVPWEPKRDGKYWRGLLPNGAKLDLFLAEPDNFGLIYLIRTGSAEFSQAVVTHALRIGMKSAGGALWRGEERISTPEELDVFRALGLTYVESEARVDGTSLRRCSR